MDHVETVNHAAGDLALAHDHAVGAKLRQMLDFRIGMGAGENQKRRIASRAFSTTCPASMQSLTSCPRPLIRPSSPLKRH